ncbi:MAG: hypothetical protein JO157_11985 [Acetobacteraceae bacterium]|nr:hypothetical protein [Acetobacteraceae bacterium]
MRKPRIGAVRAARRLNRASGMLALSVLADSAMEHYRGRFQNPAMYTPLAVSSLALLASLHGTADRRRGAHAARDAIYALGAVTSLVGFGFHLYNVGKRPGGYRTMGNYFYGAPIGAPWALALSGLFGFAAERVRDNAPGRKVTIFGLPAGRVLSLLGSGGLMGTVGEVGLLHFRGAYHDPFMYVPVTLPPAAAAALAGAVVAPRSPRMRFLTRLSLRLTALMGFLGVGFHAYGVGREMGGWRNWSQNALSGPPLPAPPSFTGVALAALAGLRLLEDHDLG